MSHLILASTSPYRRELLERLNLPFDAMDSALDEDPFKEKIKAPMELTTTLAYEKAQAIFKDHPESYVIGGDQIGLFEEEILGKPKTFEKACAQLGKMQGRTHQLVTSVCVLGPKGFKKEFTDITTLTMRDLSKEEIERYVKVDDPLNCAGSYKIETVGITLFESIETKDSTAIVGLPLIQLSQVLREIGFQCP